MKAKQKKSEITQSHHQPMELAGVLAGIVVVDPIWDRKINGIALHSDDVHPGDLFIACRGQQYDARQYIHTAIEKGAVAVIAEASHEASITGSTSNNIPIFYTDDLGDKVSRIAARFYGHPSRQMHVVGVTGTNGKTSTTHFIAHALNQCKKRCAVIGTLGYGLLDKLNPPTHTTPNAVVVQRLLADCYQSGVDFCAMEVSSHALAQARVKSVEYKTAIFTNLTRDHLDYHGTMEKYGAAKLLLFGLFGLQNAIVNIDDSFAERVLAVLPNHVRSYTYGTNQETAHVNAHHIQMRRDGISAQVKTPWGEGEINSVLMGQFNLSNLLAVLTTLCVNGIVFKEALKAVNELRDVPGRMQAFSHDDKPMVVVDYAHTPDALDKALTALRDHTDGKIWCVFGCGGDRDPGKRSEMGKIAETFADKVIVTDDNPRTEDANVITTQIFEGFTNPDAIILEHDRKKAIAHAITQAGNNDVVLIAGKGHEPYQIIGNQEIPFDDRAVAMQYLK